MTFSFTKRPPARSGIPLAKLSVEPSVIRAMRGTQWGLSGLLICSGLLAGWMWSKKYAVDEEATRYTMAAERTDALNQQFKAQLEHDQLTFSPAQIAEIQQEVQFVNQLAEKRGFSWIQLLHDLEEALPAGTSIGKIQRDVKTSTIAIDGRATSMSALNTLMSTLQGRSSFRLPVLHHHTFIDSHHADGAGHGGAGVEFSLTVQYGGIPEQAQADDNS